MGVGLYKKAAVYREKFLNRPKIGLLKRAEKYALNISYDEKVLIEDNTDKLLDNIDNLADKSLNLQPSIDAMKVVGDNQDNILDTNYETELFLEDDKIEEIDINLDDKNDFADKVEENNQFQSAINNLDGDSIEDIIAEESSNFLNNIEDDNIVENSQSLSETDAETLLVEEVEDEEGLIDADFINSEDGDVEELNEIESNSDSEISIFSNDDDVEENIEILKEINDKNYNEFTANNELDNYIPVINKQNDYLEILSVVSKEMSALEIDLDSYDNFLSIISKEFGFSKSALLIFSPPVKKFVFLRSQNLDEQSEQKLSFDLEFSNIYKTLAKEKSYLILPENNNFDIIANMLSENDKSDTEFQLYIPFIFSARIIGVFLGLKTVSGNIPDSERIKSLEILGRFNGPLLYNLFQHNALKSNKSHSINSAINDFNKENDDITAKTKELEEISDAENNQINLDISNSIENDNNVEIDETLQFADDTENNENLTQPNEGAGIKENNEFSIIDGDNIFENETLENEENILLNGDGSLKDFTSEATDIISDLDSKALLEDFNPDIETTLPDDYQILEEENDVEVDDIDSLIDPKYQKLLYFLEEKISKDLVNTISIFKLSFENISELKIAHSSFDLSSFRNDVQYVAMNAIDSDGYVNIFDNLDVISILPNITKEDAIEKAQSLVEGIKNIFNEAVGSMDVEISYTIASYPNDAEDALTLLLNLIND